jgi:hypothetical protein
VGLGGVEVAEAGLGAAELAQGPRDPGREQGPVDGQRLPVQGQGPLGLTPGPCDQAHLVADVGDPAAHADPAGQGRRLVVQLVGAGVLALEGGQAAELDQGRAGDQVGPAWRAAVRASW